MLKVCEICGEAFEPKVAKQKYCGAECVVIAARERYYANKSKPPIEPIKKVCEICGEAFETKVATKKYCSTKCKREACEILELKKSALPVEKVFEVPDVPFSVRIVFTQMESYDFKTLKQAVNFLSAYTEFEAREVLEMLRSRATKIGKYKIFY